MGTKAIDEKEFDKFFTSQDEIQLEQQEKPREEQERYEQCKYLENFLNNNKNSTFKWYEEQKNILDIKNKYDKNAVETKLESMINRSSISLQYILECMQNINNDINYKIYYGGGQQIRYIFCQSEQTILYNLKETIDIDKEIVSYVSQRNIFQFDILVKGYKQIVPSTIESNILCIEICEKLWLWIISWINISNKINSIKYIEETILGILDILKDDIILLCISQHCNRIVYEYYIPNNESILLNILFNSFIAYSSSLNKMIWYKSNMIDIVQFIWYNRKYLIEDSSNEESLWFKQMYTIQSIIGNYICFSCYGIILSWLLSTQIDEYPIKNTVKSSLEISQYLQILGPDEALLYNKESQYCNQLYKDEKIVLKRLEYTIPIVIEIITGIDIENEKDILSTFLLQERISSSSSSSTTTNNEVKKDKKRRVQCQNIFGELNINDELELTPQQSCLIRLIDIKNNEGVYSEINGKISRSIIKDLSNKLAVPINSMQGLIDIFIELWNWRLLYINTSNYIKETLYEDIKKQRGVNDTYEESQKGLECSLIVSCIDSGYGALDMTIEQDSESEQILWRNSYLVGILIVLVLLQDTYVQDSKRINLHPTNYIQQCYIGCLQGSWKIVESMIQRLEQWEIYNDYIPLFSPGQMVHLCIVINKILFYYIEKITNSIIVCSDKDDSIYPIDILIRLGDTIVRQYLRMGVKLQKDCLLLQPFCKLNKYKQQYINSCIQLKMCLNIMYIIDIQNKEIPLSIQQQIFQICKNIFEDITITNGTYICNSKLLLTNKLLCIEIDSNDNEDNTVGWSSYTLNRASLLLVLLNWRLQSNNIEYKKLMHAALKNITNDYIWQYELYTQLMILIQYRQNLDIDIPLQIIDQHVIYQTEWLQEWLNKDTTVSLEIQREYRENIFHIHDCMTISHGYLLGYNTILLLLKEYCIKDTKKLSLPGQQLLMYLLRDFITIFCTIPEQNEEQCIQLCEYIDSLQRHFKRTKHNRGPRPRHINTTINNTNAVDSAINNNNTVCIDTTTGNNNETQKQCKKEFLHGEKVRKIILEQCSELDINNTIILQLYCTDSAQYIQQSLFIRKQCLYHIFMMQKYTGHQMSNKILYKISQKSIKQLEEEQKQCRESTNTGIIDLPQEIIQIYCNIIFSSCVNLYNRKELTEDLLCKFLKVLRYIETRVVSLSQYIWYSIHVILSLCINRINNKENEYICCKNIIVYKDTIPNILKEISSFSIHLEYFSILLQFTQSKSIKSIKDNNDSDILSQLPIQYELHKTIYWLTHLPTSDSILLHSITNATSLIRQLYNDIHRIGLYVDKIFLYKWDTNIVNQSIHDFGYRQQQAINILGKCVEGLCKMCGYTVLSGCTTTATTTDNSSLPVKWPLQLHNNQLSRSAVRHVRVVKLFQEQINECQCEYITYCVLIWRYSTQWNEPQRRDDMIHIIFSQLQSFGCSISDQYGFCYDECSNTSPAFVRSVVESIGGIKRIITLIEVFFILLWKGLPYEIQDSNSNDDNIQYIPFLRYDPRNIISKYVSCFTLSNMVLPYNLSWNTIFNKESKIPLHEIRYDSKKYNKKPRRADREEPEYDIESIPGITMLTVEMLTLYRYRQLKESCEIYNKLEECIEVIFKNNENKITSLQSSNIGLYIIDIKLLNELITKDSNNDMLLYDHSTWLYPYNIKLPKPNSLQECLLLLICCLYTQKGSIDMSEKYAQSIGLELDWGEEQNNETIVRRGRPRKTHHPRQQFLQEFGDWVVEDGYYI